jgi:hypothetical protein
MKILCSIILISAAGFAQEPRNGGVSIPITANSTGVTANLLAEPDASNPSQYQTAAANSCKFAGFAQLTATSGTSYLGTVPGLPYTGIAGGTVTAGHILITGATPGRVYDSNQTNPSLVTSCIVGAALANATVGNTLLVRYGGASSSSSSSSSGGDLLRFTICVAAGCGMETTLNFIAMHASGTFIGCQVNLAIAPTGAAGVTFDVQNASSVSIFGGGTKLVVPQNSTANIVQSTIANASFTSSDKFKAVVISNDSGGVAQGGTVQCW